MLSRAVLPPSSWGPQTEPLEAGQRAGFQLLTSGHIGVTVVQQPEGENQRGSSLKASCPSFGVKRKSSVPRILTEAPVCAWNKFQGTARGPCLHYRTSMSAEPDINKTNALLVPKRLTSACWEGERGKRMTHGGVPRSGQCGQRRLHW